MELFGGSGRRRVGRAAKLVALAPLSVVAFFPLSACRKSAPPAPSEKVAPAPARPAEVVFEASLPAPREFWPRLRELAGPIGEVMPRGPELFVCGVASIPPLSAGLLDLSSPLVAVWVAGEAPGFVLGVHLASGAELIAQVSTGAHPTHRVERRAGVAYLSPASGGDFSFAVASDTLLLGPRRAVERAGDYVARTLRPRAATEGPIRFDVVGQGLRSRLVPALEAAWAAKRGALLDALGREQHLHGRPADYADPAALLGALDGFVHSALAVAGSTRSLHGEVTTAGEGVALFLEVVPDADGAARAVFSSLRSGPTDHLRRLPPSAALAVFHRRGDPDASGADFLSALFGSRLSVAENAALRRSLEQLQSGRGAAEAFALTPELGVVWRGDVTDPAAFKASLQGLLPLVTRPPIADALSGLIGRPALVRKTAEERANERMERALFRVTGKPGRAPVVKEFEVASLVGARRFIVALGKEATASVDSALSTEGAATGFGASPPWAALLSEFGELAAFVAVDLSRLGLAPADAGATLAAGARVDDGALSLRLRASDSAVRALGAKEVYR